MYPGSSRGHQCTQVLRNTLTPSLPRHGPLLTPRLAHINKRGISTGKPVLMPLLLMWPEVLLMEELLVRVADGELCMRVR